MRKLFPSMNSKPEFIRIFLLWGGYVWVFVLVPLFMPFMGAGLWEDPQAIVWVEIGYHVLNGVVMLVLIASYLKDEWFMVSTDLRYYLKHIGLTVGLILGTLVLWVGTLFLSGFDFYLLLESLPVGEMIVSHTPGAMIYYKPLFGTIALSLFSPFCICALFYCSVFAPVCYKKPWLAYVCVALVTMIPPVVDILWRGDALFNLCSYLVRLPVHLLACWSYQKTDNVWTPIGALMGTNLVLSAVVMVMTL